MLKRVSGGCINHSYKVDAGADTYFMKYNDAVFSYEMFFAEKRGLELLARVSIRVPRPIHVSESSHGSFLLMEWIESGNPNAGSWQLFGSKLAKLHQTTAATYGWDYPNYIGKLPQRNDPAPNWLDFYYERRIVPQIRLAMDTGLLPGSIHLKIDKMFSHLSNEIPDEKPALLHGDLWNGNLFFNQQNIPVFIDPAVYFGHREMDIAMMHLFGGFENGMPPYLEIFPLADQWQDRLKFWQLYYILVHVNLFGGHYVRSAHSIINFYSSRSA